MRANRGPPERRSDSAFAAMRRPARNPGSVRSWHRRLVPGHWQGRGLTMPIAPGIDRAIAEPRYKTHELFHGFFVRLPALFGGGEFRIPKHPGFGIAAR